MIVLNELRSGQWEAFHSDHQIIRAVAPDQASALRILAERLGAELGYVWDYVRQRGDEGGLKEWLQD